MNEIDTQKQKANRKSWLKGRIPLWVVAPLIAGAIGFGAIIGGGAVAWSANRTGVNIDDNREAMLHKLDVFADVLARVTNEYVVPPKQDEMIDAAINGMLASLDPHSSYMNKKDFSSMQDSTRGEYGGLGLEVSSEAGAVKVVTPMDGSPGDRAGLKSGDKIIAIDGTSILGLPLDEQVSKMRGPAGTSIDLTVISDGKEPRIIHITREIIVLHPVTHRLEGDVAYIRISTFVNENTTNELNRAIDEIQREKGSKLKGVIVDLRNNGGGLLDQAIGVTDIFMDRGEVVSTRGRNPDQVERFYGTAGEKLAGVPLVVLVNEGSASASEIVAGALQDRHRAVIIGTNSFGKGSVQSVIPLSNGEDGALRLTVARYYTPSGRSIQGAGIKPDIEIASRRVTQDDVDKAKAEFRGEEDLPNALNNDSGAKREPPHMPADMPPANWKDGEDYQLKRAIALINAGLPKTQAEANRVPLVAQASPATARPAVKAKTPARARH